MKVLVVGATGVAGRRVVPRLVEQGHEVIALVRNQDDFKKFSNIADKVFIGDILDEGSLDIAIQGCDCVINLATAIPNWEQTDKIRNEGTKILISVAQQHNVKIIQQSIIFLYGDNGDKILDESTPIKPFDLVQSAANMESLIINSNLEYIILRGGTFYGEGTGIEENWFALAKENKLQISDAEFAYNSLINVHDFANACVKAVSSSYSNTVYNVTDDYAVSDQELYDYINNLFGKSKSQSGGQRFLPSLRVSNKKIKTELLWEPMFSSYKSYLTL